MYSAYRRLEQICAAPNGPANQEHGCVSVSLQFDTEYARNSFRSCQGDSGGGLFYLKNNRWYVAGLVSYAHECGLQDHPAVFTKTLAYINWIRDITMGDA
jgi:secreted trypsin-like serine protease